MELQGCFPALASDSSASGGDALMRFLFQSRDDLVETVDITGVHATNHGAFQRG